MVYDFKFLKVKDCYENCADYVLNMSFVPYGTLDTVSEQFFRLATNKTGFVQRVLPSDEIEFVPKGKFKVTGR